MMGETCTIEIHFVNGDKKEIPGASNWGYQKAAEGNYCFFVEKDNHRDYFPSVNVNAIGKAGDFRVKG